LKGKLERFTFAELDWPMEQTKARKVLAEIFGHQATLLTISGGMMWDLFLTTEVYTGIADQVTNRLTYLDTIYQGNQSRSAEARIYNNGYASSTDVPGSLEQFIC